MFLALRFLTRFSRVPQPVVAIHKQLRSSDVLPALTIGFTTGILGILFDLSFAALIFSSSLSEYLSAGIGLVLISAAVTRIMVALMSSFPGMVADLGTVPTVILAWSAGMVAKQLPASATEVELLVTVVATIGLTSLLTGLLLFMMGAMRLGNLVRLLPDPVVGGFVASTGWLLVKGAFKVMTGQPFGLGILPFLSQPESWMQWVPGGLLAVHLLAIAYRRAHPLAMPGSLLSATALFYLFFLVSNGSIPQASVQALTLDVPAFQTPWQMLNWHDLTQIHWNAIASQWMCALTVVVTAAITLMMNVRGMELVAEQEIDTNHELKVAGITNLLVGAAGGVLSFQSMNKSVLAHKLGARSRLTTLIGAAVFIILPVVGASVLSYVPKAVLGGLLLYLGLSLLTEWVYRAWKKLPKLSYGVVQLIWIGSGVAGFLQGLALGWGIAGAMVIYRRVR